MTLTFNLAERFNYLCQSKNGTAHFCELEPLYDSTSGYWEIDPQGAFAPATGLIKELESMDAPGLLELDGKNEWIIVFEHNWSKC